MSEVPMIEQVKIDKIQPKVEQKPFILANTFVESADATFLSRLKNLLPEKARHALRLSTQKAALTGSALSILIAFGCGNVEKQNVPPPPTPTPAVSELPEGMPSSTIPDLRGAPSLAESQYKYLSVNDIKVVAIDKEGIPVFYKLPDGKKVSFDREEVDKLREEAISSGEPVIIKIFPYVTKSPKDQYAPSVEPPETLKLPADVLSEEKLKKRGIEIIQANNTNLYVRKGAFGKGAPLEIFNKISNKLTIVLIDGPVVSPYFMSDPKYAEVKKLLPEEIRKEESIVQYREKRVKEQELQVEYFRQYVKELQTQQNPSQHLLDKLSKAKGQVMSHKLFVEMYKNVMTEKDILAEMALTSQSRDKIGIHEAQYGQSGTFSPDGSRREKRSIVDATIFLAVGQVENQHYTVIYFTPEGKIGSFIKPSGLYDDMRPLSHQTHPNPKDFHINLMASPEDPTSYAYGAQTPGQALRHEVQHDFEKREKWVKKGEIPDRNEYNTDMKAMETIRQAWEKWEKSGFTDNSGYYFVFSLPEGGFILTKHESSTSPTEQSEL